MILNILGKGGHGIVVSHGKNKVFKRLSKSIISNKEVYITKYLQNIDGVPKLYDIMEDDKYYYMIMKKYSENEMGLPIKTYYKRLFEIVSNIHDCNIIHNDIKPHNILSDNGDLILIDYGNSLFADSANKVLSYTTPLYSSYESLSSKMCLKSDLWSIGVMLYYDITGVFPHDGNTIYEIFKSILNENVNFDLIKDKKAKDLIASLLDKDLNKRPNAREALNHEFFENSF